MLSSPRRSVEAINAADSGWMPFRRKCSRPELDLMALSGFSKKCTVENGGM